MKRNRTRLLSQMDDLWEYYWTWKVPRPRDFMHSRNVGGLGQGTALRGRTG